jgi:hypothetical protein
MQINKCNKAPKKKGEKTDMIITIKTEIAFDDVQQSWRNLNT